MKKLVILLSIALILVGCTSPSSVMPMSNGIYTLTKSAPTGFTPLGTIRRAAYEDINEFARSKGKFAQVVSVNEVPAGFARWPQVEVRFRLVDERQLNLSSSPDKTTQLSMVYDSTGNPIDIQRTETDTSDEDTYESLRKLGELRDSGVLTEEEFQKEKEKLLDRN